MTANRTVPEDWLLGSDAQAAEWVARVGLAGSYAAVARSSSWLRWNGSAWVPCDAADVNRAVRRVLTSVYERRISQRPEAAEVMQLLRLMDLNWRLGPLLTELRRVTVRQP